MRRILVNPYRNDFEPTRFSQAIKSEMEYKLDFTNTATARGSAVRSRGDIRRRQARTSLHHRHRPRPAIPHMITEEEFIGRINALQSQRDDALNQVVILNGQLQQLMAQVAQLEKPVKKNKT